MFFSARFKTACVRCITNIRGQGVEISGTMDLHILLVLSFVAGTLSILLAHALVAGPSWLLTVSNMAFTLLDDLSFMPA